MFDLVHMNSLPVFVAHTWHIILVDGFLSETFCVRYSDYCSLYVCIRVRWHHIHILSSTWNAGYV